MNLLRSQTGITMRCKARISEVRLTNIGADFTLQEFEFFATKNSVAEYLIFCNKKILLPK